MIDFIQEWKDQLRRAEGDLLDLEIQVRYNRSEEIWCDNLNTKSYLHRGIAALKTIITKYEKQL